MRFYKNSSLYITLGLVFTLAALMLTLCNHIIQFDAAKASDGIYKRLISLTDTAVFKTPDYIKNPDVEMPLAAVDGQNYIGTLQIPCLDIKLPVMSQWDYSKLRLSPCRYSGSVYKNNLIICAHNYNTHFGKIKALQIGETVIFTDINGNVFRFKVCDMETVSPDKPENMTDGDWDLTLFTCTLSGSSRITVRCVRET